jgi:hypothetical protein
MAARKKTSRKKTSTRAQPAQPRMTAQDRKWQAQSDLGTLTEAERIRSDRARMSAAKAEASRQTKAITKATR